MFAIFELYFLEQFWPQSNFSGVQAEKIISVKICENFRMWWVFGEKAQVEEIISGYAGMVCLVIISCHTHILAKT